MTMMIKPKSLKRRRAMKPAIAITTSLLLLVEGKIPQPIIKGPERRVNYEVDKSIPHEPFFVPETATTRQLLTEIKDDEWNVTTLVDYNTTSNSSEIFSSSTNSSRNDELFFQPIRIRAVLSTDEKIPLLDYNLTETLFEQILSPAILAWSAALRVEPVKGNLTVDKTQLVDGMSCGPGIDSGYPSVMIPESHFTEGLADTDFVIYLSLAQPNGTQHLKTESPTSAPSSENLFGGISEDNDDFDEEEEEQQQSINYTSPTANDTNTAICLGDTVAASTYCSTDQWDRPTAAMLHLCLVDDFFTNIHKSLTTVMHELAHVLGFNPQSIAHFRRLDGTPYTKRDADGNVPLQQVECTGISNATVTATLALPSSDILRFRNVRGGVRVAEVVTPNVQQTVRNHFDCFSLRGAELESSGGDDCLGDHWERRLFRTDLMNAIVDEVPYTLRISPMTLALFADSGWYQVDLSRTSHAAGWGRGAGCNFIEQDCVSNSQVLDQDFFCNDLVTRRGTIDEIQGCSPDMFQKATCGIAKYDSALPPAFQYFGDPDIGGNEPLLDFCPVYTGFSNGDCTNEASSHFFQISKAEEFGAKNSRCLIAHSQKGLQRKTSLCLLIACVVEDQSLQIKVNGVWKTCDYKGQEFPIGGEKLNVVCPDPIRTCPTFYCPLDCLGTGGVCNYKTGNCDCMSPETISNSTVTQSSANVSAVFNFSLYNYTLNATTSGPTLNYTPCFETNKTSVTFFVNKTVSTFVRFLADDSPLLDYYVPSKKYLVDDRRADLGIVWIIFIASVAVISSAMLAILFIGGYYDKERTAREAFRHALGRYFSNDNEDDEDRVPFPPTRQNKDKFVASMLVDLRINFPLDIEEITPQEISLPDTAGETDLSLLSFEDSSSDAVESVSLDMSSQPPSCHDDDESQQRDEEMLPAFTIRRRFITRLRGRTTNEDRGLGHVQAL